MAQRDVRPGRRARFRDVDDEAMLVFLLGQPVHEARSHGRAGAGGDLDAVDSFQVGRREHARRATRGERCDEAIREVTGRRTGVERQQRDRSKGSPNRRDTCGPVPQPCCNASGELPGQLGPALRQAIERRRAHAQQQAVPGRPDTGRARAAAQHADLADGLARADFGHVTGSCRTGFGCVDPDLQPAAHQQVELVAGVPLAADHGLEFRGQRARSLRGQSETALDCKQ